MIQDSHPLVSVIMGIYNCENTLPDAIDSILNQTYTNWELCLSDGSGEESPIKNQLEKYKAEDERIKVVYNKQALQISQN